MTLTPEIAEQIAQRTAEILKEELKPKAFWTVKDLAKEYSMHENTIYKLTSENEIPFYRKGKGNIYFDPAEVKEWMKQYRVQTQDEILRRA